MSWDGILMAEKIKKRGWEGKKQKEEERRREEKRKKRVEDLVDSLRAGDGVKERANQANRAWYFDGSRGLVIRNGTF